MDQDRRWMELALDYAGKAAAAGEVPVGAVVVVDDMFVAGAGNSSISSCDPSAHAEMLALRAAAQELGNYRLPKVVLYATLEPCLMCCGVAVWARVAQIVYAAPDSRYGAAANLFLTPGAAGLNHTPEVRQGPCADEAGTLIKDFFIQRRE